MAYLQEQKMSNRRYNTHGERRIKTMQYKHLEGSQRDSIEVLGFGYYIPQWRIKLKHKFISVENRDFTPREEMQAILDVYRRLKLVKEYWDFVDVAFSNGFECGRGGVGNTNFGRGNTIYLINPDTGCALSLHLQTMVANRAKKLTIKYYDENTDCGGWTWGQSKIFYSAKSLDKYLKEKT